MDEGKHSTERTDAGIDDDLATEIDSENVTAEEALRVAERALAKTVIAESRFADLEHSLDEFKREVESIEERIEVIE